MRVVCRDRLKVAAPEGRVLSAVAADINKILSPKTYDQLVTLEDQVQRKLQSNEPIDTDYWEELLRSLQVWKARAKLKELFRAVIEGQVRALRKQQREEAESVRAKLAPLTPIVKPGLSRSSPVTEEAIARLDPEPMLQLRPEDKALEVMDEAQFLKQVVSTCASKQAVQTRLTSEPGATTRENLEDGIRPIAPSGCGEGSGEARQSKHRNCGGTEPFHAHVQRRLLSGDKSSVRARGR